MESQMEENMSSTNLLSEGSYADNESMGSLYRNDGPFDPRVEQQPNTKKTRTENFSAEEDILLVDSWVNTSTSTIRGTEQSKSVYWYRIYSNYHANKAFDTSRNQVSLSNRWQTIQKAVNKFCGCLAQIESVHQSGLTQADKIVQAKELYKAENKVSFQFEHCWAILKECPKWLEERENPGRKSVRTPSSESTQPPVNLGEDNISANNFVEFERPMGRKAAKARLAKRKGTDGVDEESFMWLLMQMNERAKSTRKEKLELMRRADAREEARLEIKQRRICVEEDKIMLMDTSGLSDLQKEYIRIRQMKIIEKTQR